MSSTPPARATKRRSHRRRPLWRRPHRLRRPWLLRRRPHHHHPRRPHPHLRLRGLIADKRGLGDRIATVALPKPRERLFSGAPYPSLPWALFRRAGISMGNVSYPA